MPRPNIKRACLTAAVLCPVAAYGSFGGGPCGDDFTCHFLAWGVLVGLVGIPISSSIFAVLHLVLCNSARSKVSQLFLGGFIGLVAYEISAACGALMAAWGQSSIGHNENYPVIGLVSAYAALTIAFVVYARSNPRNHLSGEDGDAD